MTTGKNRKPIGEMTERELLVMLNERMNTLETEVGHINSMQDKMRVLDIRLIQLETKIKTWATVVGFLAGVTSSLIIKYFLK